MWPDRITQAARQNDPSGCLYSTVDRRTVVEFLVDWGGSVSDPRVRSSSGVLYLDEVALETVRSLVRVEIPPAGLFTGQEPLRVPFAFTLKRAATYCSRARGRSLAPGFLPPPPF